MGVKRKKFLLSVILLSFPDQENGYDCFRNRHWPFVFSLMSGHVGEEWIFLPQDCKSLVS
ncbi:hypothetical protein B932_2076 [Gluconobacter oxydans H24]|nr:hypothetical protein B932_2076 [Gluconobacter oxydans H24]